MSIASIVVLWLAAQTGNVAAPKQQCHQAPSSDGCNIVTICDGVEISTTTVYCGPKVNWMAPPNYMVPENPPKPVEHVIEIRTKRGMPNEKCITRLKAIVPAWTPEVADLALQKCTPVHKSLWIDGQRIGEIREVEEK